jgi:cysteine-rich repeat protein
MCAPVCGDGLVTGGEQCDDGGLSSGDGCSATCTVEPGFSCMGAPSLCQHICGDGLIVIGEVCDDGNAATGDGCADCGVEEGWHCSGEPSICAPICGDGLTLGTEECDDGEENASVTSCCSETCSFQPLGTACDDGLVCTSSDTCDGANVCGGGPRDCGAEEGNPCTDEYCDPSSGCVYTDNTAPCEDGNACTENDTCAEGECVSGGPVDCNDSDVCTSDSCDPDSGCTYEFNTSPCDDANACTDTDTCSEGTCAGSTITCNDGNVCTDDSCNVATGCVFTNNVSPCDDGNMCTEPDVCGGGTCHSGAAVYSFGGFSPPVDAAPIVNVGKAGQTFPVKWSLPLCAGGYVSRLDVVHNPLRVQLVNCETNAIEDTLETDTPGASGLTYDAGSNQYHYNWKTSTTYANKCYDLLLEFDNGTTVVAHFKFKK